MYTQFVITLIGIRNEANPLNHRAEFRKVMSMILDAGAYGKITLDEFHALLALLDEVEEEIDSFDMFLQEVTR